MKNRTASILISLAFAAALGLGLGAGGRLGRLADALVPAARADSPGGKVCSNASEHGRYGLAFSGTIDGVGSFSGVGVETCDGTGHCTGVETFNFGTGPVTVHFTSEDTINPDCTGTSVITDETGLVVHAAFVLVDDGKEIDFIGTDPGAIVSGTQKRQ